MNKQEAKISALVITFNEEENIEGLLDNLNFADEIVVVDSFSEDRTVSLIEAHPEVKLIQRKFINYTDQKSFALKQATHNWVLFLDADERLTPALKAELLKVIHSDEPKAAAYFFRRTFMFRDKVLRFSGWQSDKNYRLFQKNKVKFLEDRIVHETLQVDGQSATLKNKLLHYSYKNYEDYKGKMVKYGQMKALDEYQKGKRASWYQFILRPAYKFFNHYILRFGFLDGKRGIIICYLNALGVYSRYQEMKRLELEDGNVV